MPVHSPEMPQWRLHPLLSLLPVHDGLQGACRHGRRLDAQLPAQNFCRRHRRAERPSEMARCKAEPVRLRPIRSSSILMKVVALDVDSRRKLEELQLCPSSLQVVDMESLLVICLRPQKKVQQSASKMSSLS